PLRDRTLARGSPARPSHVIHPLQAPLPSTRRREALAPRSRGPPFEHGHELFKRRRQPVEAIHQEQLAPALRPAVQGVGDVILRRIIRRLYSEGAHVFLLPGPVLAGPVSFPTPVSRITAPRRCPRHPATGVSLRSVHTLPVAAPPVPLALAGGHPPPAARSPPAVGAR